MDALPDTTRAVTANTMAEVLMGDDSDGDDVEGGEKKR